MEDGTVEDNNTGVPIPIHISTTVIVVIVFGVALEQACSLSIKHELFRIRIGVLLSNAILCVLSLVINFDLLREDNHIHFLDTDFVLIVRTLQIFWLFIAFLIGYAFVTNSINSAYKSSSYISVSSEALSSSPNTNILKQKTPSWMSKCWAICTVIEEIVLFLFYIIAFTTTDILYFQLCFVSAFSSAIIGAVLVVFALIDILKYVYHKTRNNDKRHTNVRNLKKLNRLLVTMIILCSLVIALSSYNLYLLIQHITRLINDENHFREGTLESRALDNVTDYISYFLILICIEIIFVFWTYKPSAVNYCLFCCFGYKRYSNSKLSFRLDRNTLCYAFCKYCIDDAERKRVQLQLQVQNLNLNVEQKQIITNNTHATTTEITAVSPRESALSLTQYKIKIVLYDFDGVFTNQTHRYFEHWTEQQVAALTKQHLNIIFGSNERISNLVQHFTLVSSQNVQIYCIHKETNSKINTIFKKLQFDPYFDNTTTIGLDSANSESQVKLFILKLIKMKHIDNHHLLYISSNHENVQHLSDINLCVTYGVLADHGIDQSDLNRIQKYMMY
eukprot:174006_1